MILSTDGVWTFTAAEKAALLTQGQIGSATVGPLHNATCDLFVANLTPTGLTQFGDLTLPSWTGYAAQTVTWVAGQVTSQYVAELDGDSVSFTLPSGAVSQTIYGYAISDTTPILCGVFLLTTPQPINFAGTCLVTPVIPWIAPGQ